MKQSTLLKIYKTSRSKHGRVLGSTSHRSTIQVSTNPDSSPPPMTPSSMLPSHDATLHAVASKIRWVNRYRWCIFVVTALICGSFSVLSYLDGSWGALGIALRICPACCVIIMLAGLIAAFVGHHRHPELRYSHLLPFALVVPLLGASVPIVIALFFGRQD